MFSLGTGMKRSRVPREFTDHDLKHLISRHKKRKKEYPVIKLRALVTLVVGVLSGLAPQFFI